MPRSSATEAEARARRADDLADRLLQGVLGMIDVHTVYVGERLGLYRELAKAPASAGELARRTGTHPRYAREWLEQQAVAGLLAVDDPQAPPAERRYRLPAGHEEVLVDRDHPSYGAALARMMVGMARPLPAVLEAFRRGGGVPYRDYDADFCDGQGEMNRVQFANRLGSRWLPAVPDLHERLIREPPARVADIACGTGWSSIAIAEAYPRARVDGLDSDERSIALARRNALGAGLAERVRFEVRDAREPGPRGAYDLVTIFEALHDMARPVEALRGVRRLLAPGAAVLVADERVAERFTAPGDEVERLMYGFSVLHCLPVGMAEEASVGTGAALRPDALRRHAAAAGLGDVAVLPIDDPLWRFYLLRPG